jgi:hypothetical protein
MWKSFALELHSEWSDFADECIALFSTGEVLAPRTFMNTGDLVLRIALAVRRPRLSINGDRRNGFQ